MMSQLFHYWDNTKPGYGLHQIYWIDGSKVSQYMTMATGDDSWRQVDETRIGADREFFKHWQFACQKIANNIPAGQPALIDLEHVPYVNADFTHDYRFAVELARTIRLTSPGTHIWFDGPMIDLNREDIIASRVRYGTDKLGDLPDYIDGVVLGVYLLGAGKYVDRDINYISEMRRIAVRAFPNKKIIFSAWGQYHEAWNKTPEQYTIDPKTLSRYVTKLTRYDDNVIVFAPESPRDDYFIAELKKKSEPRLPD